MFPKLLEHNSELHCEGREDEHCKDERSDNWIPWYLLRRKASLLQSEMAGAEQADQEVVAWRVGSHGWLVPKSHPWWSLNHPMKQPESTWHSVEAEMQARLATLQSQAVSKRKAGWWQAMSTVTEAKLARQCCSEENDEAVLKLAEVQQEWHTGSNFSVAPPCTHPSLPGWNPNGKEAFRDAAGAGQCIRIQEIVGSHSGLGFNVAGATEPCLNLHCLPNLCVYRHIISLFFLASPGQIWQVFRSC